jgi:hypothetical protein
MKIILVSVGNFQDYIIGNIINLKLFNNNDITVITDKKYFSILDGWGIDLVDCNELDDCNFKDHSKLDRSFRNGFWHLCSLRFFYLYSYIKKNNIVNCLHIENDVLTYIDFHDFDKKIRNNTIYATFDSDKRVIPGILFIPNSEAFRPIIENYNVSKNDMENLADFDESIVSPFPIFPIMDGCINKFNKHFPDFNSIFDAAAIGQYLGGVDKKNNPSDTRGFVNETCVIKYDKCSFYWIEKNNLFVPHLNIDGKMIQINNLHIHSKELHNFMANNPLEYKYITKC